MNEPVLEFELNYKKLPKFMWEITKQLHIETGASPELIVSVLIGVMAYSCQDKFDVQPKNGLIHPLSLFTIILARSGCKKSTIYNLLMKSINNVQAELDATFKIEHDKYKQDHSIWKIEYKIAEKLYAKSVGNNNGISEANNNLRDCIAKEPARPVKQRLNINDATPEALIKELSEGYPSLAIMSDEAGGLFDGSLFRRSPWLNTLWCGQDIQSIRASRPEFNINDPRLGLMLMLQPGVFDRFLHSQGDNCRASGFMARNLLMDLEQVKKSSIIESDTQYDSNALEKFNAAVCLHLKQGIIRRSSNKPRSILTLSSDATHLYEVKSAQMHRMIKTGGSLENYDDLGARFMEQSARVAAVMQVFIETDSLEITRDTLEAAIDIVNWHLDHSIAKISVTRKHSDSEKLECWLEEHLVSNRSFDFRRNDLIKKGPYSIRNIDRLTSALNKLESLGKVQQRKQANINYVRFIGAKMTSCELANSLGLPNWAVGGISLSKLPV